MDYLLISVDDHLNNDIYEVIGEPKRPVKRDLQQALSYLEERFPDVIIIDLSSFEEDTLRFISSLRLMHPMANIPLLIITTELSSKLHDSLFIFSNITEVERERLSDNLAMYLEISIDQHLHDRPDELAHPYTLEQIADIWREGLSGKLLLHNQRQIKLQMGGIEQLSDLELLEQMLFQPPVYFKKEAHESTGDWITVGDILWKHAQRWCQPGFLRYRKWLRFIPTSQAHRAMDLDLNLQTRRLLFSTNSELPLLNRLREKSLRIQQVEKDLETLYFLGLYTFTSVEVSKIQGNIDRSNNQDDLILPENEFELFLIEGIEEAWKSREHPNPWSAFQLDPTLPLTEQLTSKKENYQLYLQVRSISAQRKINQVLSYLESLENWLSPIIHLYKIYGFPADPNGPEETLFCAGYRHLQQQQIHQAHEAFSQLSQEEARYRAYFGWSLFLLDNSQGQKALGLMEDALQASQSSIILHCYAAVILAKLEQWKHAEHRIRTLLQKHNFEQLRSLLWYCQKRSIPEHCWVYRY